MLGKMQILYYYTDNDAETLLRKFFDCLPFNFPFLIHAYTIWIFPMISFNMFNVVDVLNKHLAKVKSVGHFDPELDVNGEHKHVIQKKKKQWEKHCFYNHHLSNNKEILLFFFQINF